MPEPSKILVILTPAFPESEAPVTWVTSQQLMVRSLKENFPDTGIRVLSFLYPYDESEYDWHGARVKSFNGMEERRIRRAMLWQRIWQALKKMRKEKEIIGLLSFWCGECALIGHYFGKRYGIKHYCWICGQDARKTNSMVRLVRPSAGELVAMSAFLAEEFYRNHGIKPAHIIPNAIEPRQFPEAASTIKDIDVLGAGSLEQLKNYAVFIDIVKSLQTQIPGIRAMICGEGPERAKLECLIKGYQLEENISLPGLTPHHELLPIMQRSKIFLHTSRYEGFSTVCLEALYAGAQVISFCDPGQGKIPNWHIVRTAGEMIQKALELLASPNTRYASTLVYSMEDSAKAMMRLFTGNVMDHNIAYYDEAAAVYDEIMDQKQSDKLVRQKVRQKLNTLLHSGQVLDFGGGTGLDLEWLAADHYTVFFCEPAAAMREKAIRYNNTVLHNKNIRFIESSRTDFTRWNEEPPFTEKVDAILSNFGVINYIPDLDRLFSNLARVIQPGGHFILIVLGLDFKKRLKWHRRNAIRSFLLRRTFVMHIPYKDSRQTVFVHTWKAIKKAAAPYFDYCGHESLEANDFILIQLKRNEKADQEMADG